MVLSLPGSFESRILDEPECFFQADDERKQTCITATKQFFDAAKSLDNATNRAPAYSLRELLTTGLDAEQVWSQIELHNQPLLLQCRQVVKQLLGKVKETTTKSSPPESQVEEQQQQAASDEPESDNQDDNSSEEQQPPQDDEFDAFAGDEEEQVQNQVESEEEDEVPTESNPHAIVDEESDDDGRPKVSETGFFSMADMEKFADDMETYDEDGLDFEELERLEEEELRGAAETQTAPTKGPKFEEFFGPVTEQDKQRFDHQPQDDNDDDLEDDFDMADLEDFPPDEGASEDSDDEIPPPGKRNVLIAESDNDEENAQDEDDNAREEEPVSVAEKSRWAKQQEAISAQIARLEERLVSTRSWDLMGEATAMDRPDNSLMETHLDFEVADKVAPELTDEHVQALEDMIIERIKDQNFDDVIRKYEQKEKARVRKMEVSAEQNKEGLGDLYAREFMEQVQAEVDPDAPTAHDTKVDKEHEDIARLAGQLFYKLDALTNFHFTPRPPQAEIQNVSNVAAIEMEEVLPMGVSSARAQAPEEVYRPAKSERVNLETELDTKERRKRRRTKKRKKSKKQAAISDEQRVRAAHDPEFAKYLETKAAMAEASGTDKGSIISSAKHTDQTQYTRSTTVFQRLQDEKDTSGKNNKKRKRHEGEERAQAEGTAAFRL